MYCVVTWKLVRFKGFILARNLLDNIPLDQHNRLARFLEDQGHKAEALSVSRDNEHRFELALGLLALDLAFEIASTLDHEVKWKQLGTVSLSHWNVTSILLTIVSHGDDMFF
jgi:coatomer subunit beta'